MLKPPGPAKGDGKLSIQAERVIEQVLTQWLAGQKRLAHPVRDVTMEVRRNCKLAGIDPVSRAAVTRRWKALREQQASALADEPGAKIAPGHLVATRPLELVQVDHTQADVFVVDETTRRPVGRPWLSVAIDIASRCVFLNPAEVESPYWHHVWLAPGAAVCEIHRLPLATLKGGLVRRSHNLPHLLKHVGRQELERRELDRAEGLKKLHWHDL